jgi:hypothetical protein
MNREQWEALKARTDRHKPGPWEVWLFNNVFSDDKNKALAAAAPDLLAEVVRLRDALAEIWDNTKEFQIRVLAGNALDGAEVPK